MPKPADPLVPLLRRSPTAKARLWVLPFAGGAASHFRDWQTALGPDLEVWVAQLPGRENRFREKPHRSMAPLVHELAEAVTRQSELPFALFGHSMGALVAHALVLELERRGGPQPLVALCSAIPAPHLGVRTNYHRLDDQAFRAAVKDMGAATAELLENDELYEVLAPMLRADFELLETWTPALDAAKVRCPLVALGGLDDASIPVAELDAWGQLTPDFSRHLFPGGHFFIATTPAPVHQLIARAVLSRVKPTPATPG